MKKSAIILFLVLIFTSSVESYACTSAIVSKQKSSEGAPLLWKHRDSPTWNGRVAYIEGGKYAYTALVSLNGKYTYCGINEKGFAVMNTVSHNIKMTDPKRGKGSAIALMDDILRECATVDEFEAWLAKSNGKRGYVTNYAVGEPSGEAAYFEVSQESYKRYNISDRAEGYEIRANYSFSGDMVNIGESGPRYEVIANQMRGGEKFTPYQFIDYSRNYLNNKGVCVLSESNRVELDNTSVARYISSASAVMVCDAKNPRMLVAVGHPAAAMAVPVYVKAKNAIPECVSSRAMLDLCNDFRTKCYEVINKEEHAINKPLIAKVLSIDTKCKMPQEFPANIEAFNAKIDKLFGKHAKRVRKVLN
jgi:hypothetical protein